LIRRFLQHVLPEGWQKVRHCGFLHASCALSPATIRLLMGQGPPPPGPPPPPQPRVRPAVRPVVHRCTSSCGCGPPSRTLLRPAESHDVVLTSGVRHGWSNPRHWCACLAPAGHTRRLRTGTPPPASIPQTRRGAPRKPPWSGLTPS
jgi:hypothetical protein